MTNYDDLINYYSQKNNVDPKITKAVFQMESSGGVNNGKSLPNDPDSPIGPMQLRPSTAKSMGIDDPTNIDQALDAGTKYLRIGLDSTKSPEGAFGFYYSGTGDDTKWGPKTQAYVAKGTSLYPNMKISSESQITDNSGVQAGKTLFDQITGGSSSNAKIDSTSSDPGVQAGKTLFDQITGGSNSGKPQASTTQSVQSGKALFDQMTAGLPETKTKSDVGVEPDISQQIGSGAVHGFTGVGDAIGAGLNRFAIAADQKYPFLAAIDKRYGIDPQANLDSHNKLSAQRESDYQNKFGDSTAAQVGDFTGQVVATLPVGGVIGKAGTAATKVIAGTFETPVGQLMARGIGNAITGAVQGGTAAGITGGDVKEGALAGGLLSGTGQAIGVGQAAISSLPPEVKKAADWLIRTGGKLVGLHYGDFSGYLGAKTIVPMFQYIAEKVGKPSALVIAHTLDGTIGATVGGVAAGKLQPANKLGQYFSPLESSQD